MIARLACLLLFIGCSAKVTLDTEKLKVGFSADGLQLDLLDVLSATAVKLDTSWNITLATQTLAPETCALAASARTQEQDKVRVTWRCVKTGPQPSAHLPVEYSVDVDYAVAPGQRFLSKTLRVASSLPHSNKFGSFFLRQIAVWRSTIIKPLGTGAIESALVTGNPSFADGSIAAWARMRTATIFFSIATPFARLTAHAVDKAAATMEGLYRPEMEHNASFPTSFHEADMGVLGFADQGQYKDAATDLYASEAAAFRRVADALYLDGAMRRNRTVKVNVAWDENDYQIDVAKPEGWKQYRRIIDRNSELGIDHLVFEPQNSRHSSRFNTSDGWGWEHALWFGMGERLRMGAFDPRTDPMPRDITDMVAYARGKGVRLLAYVYPCLSFEPVSQHWIGGAVDLSVPEAAAWLQSVLVAFMEKSGAGGFAWDHDIFAGPASLHYAQWRAWMGILKALRERFPDIVMDHRQQNHLWGPWYQFAGSYAEPLASDENPETYGVGLPSLHTDHIAANQMRDVNWMYSVQQLLPASRIPGFMFHQSERSHTNGTVVCEGGNPCLAWNTRDFDYQGYRYSVISNIATAGLNSVVTMIPARDESEFTLFPERDLAFIRGWLAFADRNIAAMARAAPIPTLPKPGSWGQVDGWHAMSEADEGFIFLFNPCFGVRSVTLPVNEAVGLSNKSAGSSWLVTELYPNSGRLRSSWTHGTSVTVEVGSSDALALQLTKAPSSATSAPAPPVASGPRGRTVRVPWGQRPSQATACAQLPASDQVDVTFAGPPVEHGMAISKTPVPAGFAGGWFNTSFSISGTIRAQLRGRQARYPVPWTARDRNATWLDPSRLLMAIAYAHPRVDEAPHALLNGSRLPVLWGSNARDAPSSASQRLFMGYFIDASSLAAEETHYLALWMPPVPPGAFLGLFWENLDTEYTTDVAACASVGLQAPTLMFI